MSTNKVKKPDKQPGSGYWGTGVDLKQKRDKPDKAEEWHKKGKDKDKDKDK